ncbi:MAG TPA: DUF3089 domain-containing protein [Polyangiales bacterium]|nr:DUF3089 domain-containing protein [Polyangiales bacterium]
MNARSLFTAVVLLVGSAACDDDKDTDSHEHGDASAEHEEHGGKDGGDAKSDEKAKDEKAAADDKAKTEENKDAKDEAKTDDTAKEAADYSKADNWLCRPGHNTRCEIDLNTTVVKADGSTEKETFEAKTDPAIDCFYVYPTVSLDTTPNSDLNAGPEEESVVRAQFARFGSQCRLFAPLYRQVTLTALRANLAGMPATDVDREIGLKDVTAAFKHYLDNDNKGRAFVLIGHSQGSSVLTGLIKSELDKDSVDKRFLTAILAGTNILVPKGKKVGGTFTHVPVCESFDQLGCVETYSSFRDNSPPPDNSLFAVSSDEKLEAACTNPAKAGDGSAELHAYLSTKGSGSSSKEMGEWAKGLKVETPFVSAPGLLSGECKHAKTGYYLSIKVNADDKDARADDISGDVVTNGEPSKEWGLHLIDIPLVMGNLLDLTKTKAEAYAAKK